jgi:uncharacterized membrane protein YfcA
VALCVATGFAGGVLAGLLGVGSGAIFVPAIVILGLSGGDDPRKVAQGLSLAAIVATAALGTATSLRQDAVDLADAAWVARSAVTAAFLPAFRANRLDADILKRIYGAIALILGVGTMCSAWRGIRHEAVG